MAGAKAERVKMATILDKLNNAGDNKPLWFDPNCKSPPQNPASEQARRSTWLFRF